METVAEAERAVPEPLPVERQRVARVGAACVRKVRELRFQRGLAVCRDQM